MRIAIIDYEKCKPESCGKECESFCPRVRAGDETVKFAENEKPVIDESICIGCGICVSPNTEIRTCKGMKQIKELKKGDKVLTQKGRFSETTDIFTRKHTGRLYRISMYGLPEQLVVTEGHPILAIARKPIKAGKRLEKKIKEADWMPPEELKKGYYVTIPIIKEIKESKTLCYNVNIGKVVPFNGGKFVQTTVEIPCEPDFFRLVGYYLAEGSTDDRKLVFSFHEKETEYIDDVISLIKKYFNINSKKRKNSGRGTNVVVDSAKVTRIFKNFGTFCDIKSVGESILWPKDFQKELIKGLWRGDGYIEPKRNYFVLSTTSKELAYENQHILARLNIASSITKSDKENKKTAYHVSVFGDSVEKMAEVCDVPFKERRNRKASRILIDADYIYLPIKKIEVENVVEFDVMNLEVKNDETYVASGIIVHNCVKKCPRDAIRIVNTPEQLKEQPLHRFGKNGFALFRLPFPVKGEVVGLLGQNGLGKSSALKILTGNIKLEHGMEELLRQFRGTELQDYLEKMFKQKIRTVLKPQMLHSDSKSTALEVLQKSDEKGMMNEIINELELQNFLDRKLQNLSGGELQRLAIASAALRKADVYYFDEPSSFLDVKQRINAAKIIRSLAKDAAVMVVEHDLASLDIMADKVHIFYGEPGCYGIISKPYGVRVGINAFLDGFIKEDNVRIHDPVDFSFSKNIEQTEKYLQFPNLKKRLDGFSLSVDGGDIRKKEIIGIFGANGLGKTTFARILAGEIEPDTVKMDGISISYKPQYLSSEFEGTVLELLESTIRLSEDFKSSVLHPLGLDRLFENNVKKLSGGEMQRLAIALCLGKKADMYLLDEPSAYLDSMQRMTIAKIIRRIAEKSAAVVIDHDLLFLNYVSDRAMLFTGESGKTGFAKHCSLENGMNEFLKTLDITFRKETETGRPRANKPGSQKDGEQKASGNYFLG